MAHTSVAGGLLRGLGLGITWLSTIWVPLAIIVTAVAITLHSSLQHEVLHGHPFRIRLLNQATVFLPLGLVFPYGRFRDSHLAHHRDEFLTDPYDDPELNFQDPELWPTYVTPDALALAVQQHASGADVGRAGDRGGRLYCQGLPVDGGGDRAILRDYLLHLVGLIIVARIVQGSDMPGWAYLVSAYGGMSILKIRTYLEHRAHDLARCRTVIIDGGVILPFLFLNNNLHVVHHAKPSVAWYKLPALYRANRDEYLRRNEGYRYSSYAEVFRHYFFKAKDPVPHPMMRPR